MLARIVPLLLALSACQKSTVAPQPAPEAAPVDDGELRARDAGAGLIGQRVPGFVLTTIDGQTIDLAALAGKQPVYLKFWATWCVPCREQMPEFARVHAELQDRLAVVAVNTGFSDDEAAVRAYREQLALKIPIVIDDGSLAGAFNLRVTPQHVVIGRDGRIAHVGHLADDRLAAALREVLADAGDPAPTSASPPPPDPQVLAPGDMVGGVSLITTDGAAISLAPDGRPTALMFFAPWCEPYLADSRPDTSRACRRVREEVTTLAAKPGVRWIGVSSGLWTSAADLNDYAKTNATNFPLALDASGAVFRRFAVRQLPSVAVIDATGKLVRMLGPEDHDIAGALAAIAVQPAP